MEILSLRHVIRKIGTTGDSRSVTLPSDWIKEQNIPDTSTEVDMIYNDIIIIFPPDYPIEQRHQLERQLHGFEANS